jgi:selenoprotein W-related protein
MVDLTKKFEAQIKSIGLIPSGGGLFEVVVDGELVYSKAKTGRHPEKGEVENLIASRV